MPVEHASACACCGFTEAESRSGVLTEPLSDGIRALLSVNDAPTDIDRESLRAMEREIASGIEEVEGRISSLLEALEVLRNKKGRAETKLAEIKTVLNPVRTLPMDVVLEIMHFALDPAIRPLPSYHTGSTSTSIEPTFPIWTLSQISHSWRDLAIHSPGLWSHIIMDNRTTSFECQTLRTIMYKLGLFLERSRNRDLSVTLFIDKDKDISFMGSLETTVTRWKHLHVSTSAQILHGFAGLHFPRLVSLLLCISQNDTAETGDIFRSACPNLQTCAISGVFLATVGLPWNQLKSLQLEWVSFTTQSYIDILPRCTSLEEFRLNVLSHSQINPQNRQVALRLPRLRRLQIYSHSTATTQTISHTISLFSLQSVDTLHLFFNGDMPELPDPTHHIQPRCLVLCTLGGRNAIQALNFLSGASSIQSLELRSRITVDFIRGLTVRATGPSILPQMKTLIISKDSTPQRFPDVLLDMVESRFGQDASFEFLEKDGVPFSAENFNRNAYVARWNDFLARRYPGRSF